MDRTDAAVAQDRGRLAKVKGVEHYVRVRRNWIRHQTSRSNVATLIATLTPWDERKSKDLQLDAILAATQRALLRRAGGLYFAFGLPPIIGLSNTGGFQFMLEDRRGGELRAAQQVADALVDAARKHPEIRNA